MMRSRKALLGLIVFASGCGIFTPPKEHPVIEQYATRGFLGFTRETTVYSTTPERRTVMVMTDLTAADAPTRFCAEAPADVAENISSSFKALVEAEVKAPAGQTGGQGRVELAKAFSSSIVSLFYRSQGVQLFRDGMYNLCQAFINRAISGEQFFERSSDLRGKTFVLISAEIPTAQAMRAQDAAQRAESARGAVESALGQARDAEAAAKKHADRAEEAIKKMLEGKNR